MAVVVAPVAGNVSCARTSAHTTQSTQRNTRRLSWVIVSRKNASKRSAVAAGRLPNGEVRTDLSIATVVPSAGSNRSVTLYLDGVPSSHNDLDDPTRLEFKYMQWLAGMIDAWFPSGTGIRAMHIGGAGCTMARYICATRPSSHQLALEVDAKLANLVRQWFDLPRAPQLKIRVEDGRIALESSAPQRWDLIIRDAFVDSEVPRHLAARGTVAAAHRALSPKGIYLANCADYPPLPLARREVATLREFFGAAVLLVAEPGVFSGRRHGNVILLAAKDASHLGTVATQIAKNMRTSAIPARMLHGRELEAFSSGAQPFID